MLANIRSRLKSSPMAPALCLGTLLLAGCGGSASADESRPPDDTQNPSLIARIGDAVFGKKYELPSGTKIPVRLEHAVSTSVNSPGDRFTAILDKDLTADGKLVAPKGSLATGVLTEVEGSKRVKGRALLQMKLTSLSVDGDDYSLQTRPVTYQAQATKKKDALVIGGSSAVGAVIGAIAGGGKGAAIGSGVGAGAGTGLVLSTKGKEVELGAEARVNFVLSDSIRLPEYQQPAG